MIIIIIVFVVVIWLCFACLLYRSNSNRWRRPRPRLNKKQHTPAHTWPMKLHEAKKQAEGRRRTITTKQKEQEEEKEHRTYAREDWERENERQREREMWTEKAAANVCRRCRWYWWWAPSTRALGSIQFFSSFFFARLSLSLTLSIRFKNIQRINKTETK